MALRNWLWSTLGILLLVGFAFGAPIQWAGNGHYYDVSQVALRWSDAKLFAESQSFKGISGHLVTITSPEEDAFVLGLNLQALYYYTGALQQPETLDPAANWSWITGEPWTYQHWVGAEPNDAFGAEDNMVLMKSAGGWGDIDGDDLRFSWTVNPFVVEYDTVIPEPASFLLLGSGLLAALAFLSPGLLRKRH